MTIRTYRIDHHNCIEYLPVDRDRTDYGGVSRLGSYFAYTVLVLL
jgi:hypothetical protein